MKLKLLRVTLGDTFTESKIYVDGVHECYTVEDKDRYLEEGVNEKVYGETAIPRGTYKVDITYSSRFKRKTIEIKDVPYFTGIRIHSGNSSKDSEGCPIVGSVNERDDDDWVGGSKIAEKALLAKVQAALDNGEDVTIEVT